MAPIQRLLALLFPLALALLIGCGGSSGSGPGGSPSALTRTQVRDSYARSLMAFAQSGAVPSGGSTGASTGGSVASGGMPFVGAFVNGLGGVGPGRAFRSRLSRGETGGDPGGTSGSTDGGGSGEVEIYYDEYLQLWVESAWTETSMVSSLFEDEQKTKPAGSFSSVFDLTGARFTSEFAITAGPFAGAVGTYVSTFEEDGTWTLTYDNLWPTWGRDKGSASWSEEGSEWQHRSEPADGSWFESQGRFLPDGSGTASGSDSHGFAYTFTYRADGSGQGRVTGPEPGLPATISWTPDGRTRIVWADGSVTEFGPEDLWGDGGTTGGSGGTGGEPGP